MTESTLPLTGPKPQQSAPGQSICAANARKLAVLLVLLLSGCAGLGFKFWLEIKASSIALDQMIGSHECPFDDGIPAHRVCIFKNLIMFNGQLHYIYSDPRPQVPDIQVNFHHDYHFELVMLHVSAISAEMHTAATEAEVIKAATLTWRQWHLNYYHGFGESVFEVFALACKYLHFCGGSSSADLVPIFIERGQANDQASWAQFLPAAETALKCLFPGPNHFIGDERIRHKLFLLKTSAAGIGPFNRKWRGFFEQGNEFKRSYAPVDKEIATAYRQRLIRCYGLTYKPFHPEGPYQVTIVNRQYHMGRHMVNAAEVAQKLEAMPQIATARVVYMEPLHFNEQIKVFASSQILLMTHGAALVNILFMPEGSVAVLYNWLQRETLSPHTWVTDYMNDLHLPVSFVGLSTQDRRFMYPQKERFVFSPEYAGLPADQKALLLETGLCPPGGLPGCDDMKLNFAVDWTLLAPAMTIAFGDMSSKHKHILDGTPG